MADALITSRVTKKMEHEIEEFMKKERVDRSTAVRKLLAEALDKWKLDTSLDMLEKGEATFNYAAKFAGIDVWEFSDRVKESGIVWIKEDPERLRKELRQI